MKKLLIVCEEKYRVFGDYMAQLISLEDDTDCNTIGVRDGEVAAQVWLENEYKSNSAQVSSNQYILFIGHNKLIKEKSCHMKVVYSEYGISYGWLGKQAAIIVDKAVPIDDYDAFLNFALKYQKDLEKLVENKKENSNATEIIGSNEKRNSKRALDIVKQAVAIAPQAGTIFAKKLIYYKKIENQQWSFAVMKFYLDSLAKFLGM